MQMATIRMRFINDATSRRRLNGSECKTAVGITSDGKLCYLWFTERDEGKLQRAAYVSMSGCRVAPRGDDIMLNIDDTTNVVTAHYAHIHTAEWVTAHAHLPPPTMLPDEQTPQGTTRRRGSPFIPIPPDEPPQPPPQRTTCRCGSPFTDTVTIAVITRIKGNLRNLLCLSVWVFYYEF